MRGGKGEILTESLEKVALWFNNEYDPRSMNTQRVWKEQQWRQCWEMNQTRIMLDLFTTRAIRLFTIATRHTTTHWQRGGPGKLKWLAPNWANRCAKNQGTSLLFSNQQRPLWLTFFRKLERHRDHETPSPDRSHASVPLFQLKSTKIMP